VSAAENLRLRVLLTWAVEFVELEVQCMEESYRVHPDGAIEYDDEDVADEMRDAHRWLTEAREALA
jgi:hypothetical protein